MNIKDNTITWYVAQNYLGEFSRGEDWVKDLSDARLHIGIGPVKSIITRYVKTNPDVPVPIILEWKVSLDTARAIDVTDQTKKSVKAIANRKLAREQKRLQREREYIDRNIQSLQAQRSRLNNTL